MKNFKKLTAAVAATLMAATMVAPMAMNSFAEGTTVTINFNKPAGMSTTAKIKNHAAYKIFKLEKLGDNYNVTGWQDDKIMAVAIAAYNEINTVEDDDISDITASSSNDAKDASAKKVSVWLEKNKDNTATIEAFAKTLANNIAAANDNTAQGADTNDDITPVALTVDDSGDSATMNQDPGYYIFTCQVKESTGDKWLADSLGMLTIVDATEVSVGNDDGEAKVGLPTVTKKVQEDSAKGGNTPFKDGYQIGKADSAYTQDTDDAKNGYNDIADYSIGEPVPFKIYGTLPEDYEKYDSYKYKFTDNLDEQFDAPKGITVNVDGKEYEFTPTTSQGSTTWACKNVPTGTIGDETTVSLITITQGTTAKNGTTHGTTDLVIDFPDLKQLKGNNGSNDTDLTKDSVITVSYEAVLNKNAIVGTSGQDNKVKLTYSNNPNKGGEGTTGDTPEDKNRVYTFGIDVEKFFVNATGGPLTVDEIMNEEYASVKFNLYKDTDKVPTDNTEKDAKKMKFSKDEVSKQYYPDKDNSAENATDLELSVVNADGAEWTVGTDSESGIKTISKDTTTYYYNAKDKTFHKTFSQAEDGTETYGEQVIDFAPKLVLKVKGLDAGTYYLDEYDAPEAFNKNSQVITITAKDKGTTPLGGGETVYGDIYTQDFEGEDTLVKIDNDANNNFYADAVVNNTTGSSLPSTGGMGTKLFYLGGGAMVAVAGIFLITKKRMKKEEV